MRALGKRPGLLLVLGVALAWRVLFFSAIQDTPLAYSYSWEQSDMHSFWTQAALIAHGDWLAREPYYPYHDWMKVYPQEEWARWHDPRGFYQPPLYSYFLAILMLFGQSSAALAARAIQLALGVVACGLMYRLAKGLFGGAVGTVAGLMLAVYGPLLAAESVLLRDGPILCLTLLVLVLATGWLRGARAQRGNRQPVLLFSIGLLVGVQAMLHEAALMIALLLVALGWWRLRGLGLRRQVAALGFFAAGGLLGYAPLALRNLALGLSPMPFFFGSFLAMVTANNPYKPPEIMTNFLPPQGYDVIMRQAGGNVFQLVSALASAYDGHPGRWLENWGMRLGALALSGEPSENLCQGYFRLKVPILAFTVGFGVVAPCGVAGIALWGRRRWASSVRRGAPAALLLAYGILMLLMLSAVLPFGRYRMVLLPLLIPFGARALVAAWLALRRHSRRALAYGLTILALAGGQWALGSVQPWKGLGQLRATDFLVSSYTYMRWNEEPRAAAELTDGLALGVDSPLLLQALGWLRATAADPAVRNAGEALALAERLAATGGVDRAAALDLRAAALAELDRFDEAIPFAQQALDLARANQPDLAAAIQRRLQGYMERQPARTERLRLQPDRPAR